MEIWKRINQRGGGGGEGHGSRYFNVGWSGKRMTQVQKRTAFAKLAGQKVMRFTVEVSYPGGGRERSYLGGEEMNDYC